MAAPAWLCDIVAGQTWRFATRELSYDGNAYTDGLGTPGSFEDALSFALPADVSMAITVSPQAVADFDAEDVARGATATVYWWEDPDDGDPVVVVQGTVEDPEYGGADEPLTATVREVPWDDRGRIPQIDARINDDTWPSRDTQTDIDDEFYPLIFGEPGYTTGDVFGSPAYWVEVGGTDYLLIAGHPVLATSIWLDDLTGPSTSTAAVSTMADGLGRQVAVCDATAWAGLTAGDELWATWYLGGGMANPNDPTVALSAAGDVLEYMLHRSTLRVDWGRVRAAKALLNGFRIDAYVQPGPDDRVRPWEWIAAHLLPILPVSVRSGPSGLYLAVFDPASPATVARVALEDGRNCERISPVSVDGVGDVANDFRLSYAPYADRDKGSRSVRVTGSRAVLDADNSAIRSAICEESVRRFGVVSREFATAVVYDDSTATRILLAMAALDALPTRSVTYALDGIAELDQLEPGDLVTVTDLTLGWTAVAAYVWTVRVAESREVTLRLWHQPGRDYAITT